MKSSKQMLRLEAENSDASASFQLFRYFVGLPRPQKNCLCLASALTWCASALARTDSGSRSTDSDSYSVLVTYFHVHSFQSIIPFYQQS